MKRLCFERRVFLLVTLSVAAALPAYTQGKWVKLAPFPEPIAEIAGAASGGKLYVFGGLGPNFEAIGMVYEYDPASDKWTKKKPMPAPAHHLAITELNGKIYIFGGFDLPASGPQGWVPIDHAWEYTPAADAWKSLAPMPSKRGSAVAATVNGKIYVIGGATFHPGSKEIALYANRPHRSVPDVDEYDPATNKWSARSPMPTARNHAGVGAVNGKIYVIGGRIGAAFMGTASNTDVVEEYDPASDSWGTVRLRMPTPRSAGAAGVYGGMIYVAGGEYQNAQLMGAFRALEAYNPATNQWVTMPNMPSPRHGFASAVIGNRFYIISGHIQTDGVTNARLETNSDDAFEIGER